jgi:hypothetical protein
MNSFDPTDKNSLPVPLLNLNDNGIVNENLLSGSCLSSSDGIVNGITRLGSMYIKSIRTDYNDVPFYKSWGNNKTCTRLEYKQVNLHKSDTLDILYTGRVTKMKLLNLPIGIYTLYINGMNVMSSTNMTFDIENTYSKTLNSLVSYGEERLKELFSSCMCGNYGSINSNHVDIDV